MGAAVGIDSGGVQLPCPDDGERLSGERFVQFDDADVIEF